LFSGRVISSANASHGGDVHKIAICSESGKSCAAIKSGGCLAIKNWD